MALNDFKSVEDEKYFKMPFCVIPPKSSLAMELFVKHRNCFEIAVLLEHSMYFYARDLDYGQMNCSNAKIPDKTSLPFGTVHKLHKLKLLLKACYFMKVGLADLSSHMAGK